MTNNPGSTPHRARVLIVDDERRNRELLEVMLQPEGFFVMTASSGEDALAQVMKQPPDLILLDVMMPGMDGYAVAGEIKAHPATTNIPVIMVTALDDRSSRLHGLKAGAEDFLTKPVDRLELCVRVRNLVRLKTHADDVDQYSRRLEGEVVSRTADLAERATQAAALEHLRQEQLRFKDEFLSHVSHELRSPLTAIKQFTSILLAGIAGELNAEQREYQEIVLRNIRQLQAMIDDLLEVTRLESGKLSIAPEAVSVRAAVIDGLHTLEGAAAARGITLSHDVAESLPDAFADPTRLRQILIILLDNAIKFTPAGGAVSVRAQRLRPGHRLLLVQVSDTGCGIAPAIRDTIFERLYQQSESVQDSRKGLGLGLYICRELVTRQGGRIWAKRRRPVGTVFSFTVPVQATTSGKEPHPPEVPGQPQT